MFAPVVVVIRQFMGDKPFTQLRGKLIAQHSRIITEVCNKLGVDRTRRQQMIRLARDNGKRLGFLA